MRLARNAKQLEVDFDQLSSEVAEVLRWPNCVSKYERLMELFLAEAALWKAYVPLVQRRLSWLGAMAAAERARGLADYWANRATATAWDSGLLRAVPATAEGRAA